MTKVLKAKCIKNKLSNEITVAERARFVLWKHLQLFKFVWEENIAPSPAGACTELGWIRFHQRFCAQHHVHDPLLRRVLGEFIQHVSETARPNSSAANVLATGDAKFDAIDMSDAEIQNWMFRPLFERRELFTSETNDVAANREALRIVVSEHIPAFFDQAFTFPSTAPIQEYFDASR